jgi:hypothetical protein
MSFSLFLCALVVGAISHDTVVPLTFHSVILNLTRKRPRAVWRQSGGATSLWSPLDGTSIKYFHLVRVTKGPGRVRVKNVALHDCGVSGIFLELLLLAFKHSSSFLPQYSPAECCKAQRLEGKGPKSLVQCSIRRKMVFVWFLNFSYEILYMMFCTFYRTCAISIIFNL